MFLDVTADVPPNVTTVTPTIPAWPAGMIATIWVAVSLTIFAAALPNMTAVAWARFVPLMISIVPPFVGPEVEVRRVTVGAAI